MAEDCDSEFKKVFNRHGGINYHYTDRLVIDMDAIQDLDQIDETLREQKLLASLVK